MNQYPTQTLDTSDDNAANEVPIIPSSDSAPFKKLLPIIAIIAVILMLVGGFLGLFLLKPQSPSKVPAIPSPTRRPTATPILPKDMPLVTSAAGTISASITPKKEISRLVFIRDGDIYHSDLSNFSLLVKNATPAGDELSWSPLGNFLAWRPKAEVAPPSAITIYSREGRSSFTIQAGGGLSGEITDYAWSPDEEHLAVLVRENKEYAIWTQPAFRNVVPRLSPLVKREMPIKQVLWSKRETIMFSGSDGISSIEIGSSSATLLVSDQHVLNIRLAPKADRLLYTLGDNNKSDLYLINIDGSGNQLIPAKPAKVDMGDTNLPETILNNGFIPHAIWMPSGDRLIVGYRNSTSLPLVGIYNLEEDSFTAIAPFLLGEEDLMIDNFRLLGVRENTTSKVSTSWQLSFFTLENNAKLAVSRVIPDAYSPAFFNDYVGR